MPYQREKEISIDAVLLASRLCEQVRGEMASEPLEKSDGTPVTVADFVSQAVICQAIESAFPNDPIVAEEDSAMLQGSRNGDLMDKVIGYVRRMVPVATPESVTAWIDRGKGGVGPRYWTLDPIDGTKGFLRGDQYAVAVALVEEGVVKVGVLGCPSLVLKPEDPASERGVLFVAVHGHGAVMLPISGGNADPIQVASGDMAENLPFVESVESAHSDHSRQEAIAKEVGIKIPSLRMDGQVKYGAVARGQALLYLRFLSPRSKGYKEKIWDHAAGALIVEEAGGRVTDMCGDNLDFSQGPELINNKGIIASNGSIHDKVIEALKSKGYLG